MTTLSLCKPAVEFAAEYQAFVRESIATDGDYRWNNAELALEDFAAYVQELHEESQGIGLPDGVPPQQTYFVVINEDTVIGEMRYRPTITEPYEDVNGHLGLNLRPGYRSQGYGHIALQIMFDIARQDGLDGLFIPITGENVPSKGVTTKNGGKLIKTIEAEDGGDPTFCYWIDLTS